MPHASTRHLRGENVSNILRPAGCFARRLYLAVSFVAFLTTGTAYSTESLVNSSGVRGVSVGGLTLTEDSCELLLSTEGEKPEMREAPGMHVLDRTAARPLRVLSLPGAKVHGIVCWRSDAALAPNDYLVAMSTGLPLYIKADTESQVASRTIVLERNNALFTARLLTGSPWTQAEEREIGDALKEFNRRATNGSL